MPEMGTMVGTVGVVVAGTAFREVGEGMGEFDVEFSFCWSMLEVNFGRDFGGSALGGSAAGLREKMALQSNTVIRNTACMHACARCVHLVSLSL